MMKEPEEHAVRYNPLSNKSMLVHTGMARAAPTKDKRIARLKNMLVETEARKELKLGVGIRKGSKVLFVWLT